MDHFTSLENIFLFSEEYILSKVLLQNNVGTNFEFPKLERDVSKEEPKFKKLHIWAKKFESIFFLKFFKNMIAITTIHCSMQNPP